MKRSSSVVLGLTVSTLFSVVLNIGGLTAFFAGTLTVADIGAHTGSADEAYYFALIRDIADGNIRMGNASLLEHRNAPSVAGYALLPQGLLALATGWSVALVALLGDLFFTSAIAFLIFLLARRIVPGALTPIVFMIAFMAWYGVGWQRTMNPQVTMFLFLLGLLVFFQDHECRRAPIRGALLGLLFLVQPIFAAFLLSAEAVDGLLAWRASGTFRLSFSRRLPILLGFVLAALLQLFLQSGADTSVLLDTYHRRGLIESRLPAAPRMQATLLFVFIPLFFLWRRTRTREALTLLLLIFCGLLVLNQSVLHGKDGVFGLYYRLPLNVVLWLSVLWIAQAVLSRRIVAWGAGVLAAFMMISLLRTMTTMTIPQARAQSALLRESRIEEAFALLHPQTQVVLAPLPVANLVPVLTPHYALFTQYAHYEYGGDQEMAEHYLLQNAIFPLDPQYTVEGHPLVFGLYAGNLYARTKTMCRLGLRRTECDRVLSDFIVHQDIRRFTEEGAIDPHILLKKYGVTAIVTDQALPRSIVPFCTVLGSAGSYVVYDCDFDR